MESGHEALHGIAADGAPATLQDGRRILLRPVRAGDAAALQSFVRGLSSQSRRNRFFGGLTELTPYMLGRLTQPVHPRELGLVALSAADGRSVVGTAQYALDEDRRAELGVAVADSWQRQGLGTHFLRLMTGHALRSGARALSAVVLAGNRPVLALLARHGWTALGSPEPGLTRMEKPLTRVLASRAPSRGATSEEPPGSRLSAATRPAAGPARA